MFTLFVLITSCAIAQKDSGFGIKAGLNYGATGDLSQDGQTIIDNPERKIGYHVGMFGKIDLDKVYLRPELIYTQLNNTYNGVDASVRKLDLPLLLGVYVVKPISVFAGPSLQYIIDTDLQDVDLQQVQEAFTVGLQVGLAVDLGNVGVDLRYERGFTENEAAFTQVGQIGSLDTRPEQIILAISVKF